MKRLIITSFFIIIALLCFNQEYDSIVVSGKRLSIGNHNGGAPFPVNSFYELIGEDTTINETIYKKILHSDMNNEFDPTYTMIGFIRETEDRKVYLRDLEGLEGLYYDYYVEEGDTMNFYNPFTKYFYEQAIPSFGDDTLVIVENVHFETFEGLNRKVYDLSAFGEYAMYPETFIEGVGSISGHYYSSMYKFYALVGSGISLLCADNDGSTIYHNPLYSYCFITKIKHSSSFDNVEIYPNPCSDSFRTKVNETDNYRIYIYNILGEKVFEKKAMNNQEIDISRFNAGTYIIKIVTSANTYTNKLLISQ